MQIVQILSTLQQEILEAAVDEKSTFIFAYFASHGCITAQDQHMILNSTSVNLLNVEQAMKNLCAAGKGKCCVIAFYDFYKLPAELYIDLTLKESKAIERSTPRQELPEGSQYYKLVSADLKGIVNSELPGFSHEVRLCVMAVECLNLFRKKSAENSTILIPYDWADFPFGALGCAVEAPVLKVHWVSSS